MNEDRCIHRDIREDCELCEYDKRFAGKCDELEAAERRERELKASIAASEARSAALAAGLQEALSRWSLYVNPPHSEIERLYALLAATPAEAREELAGLRALAVCAERHVNASTTLAGTSIVNLRAAVHSVRAKGVAK